MNNIRFLIEITFMPKDAIEQTFSTTSLVVVWNNVSYMSL